MSLDIDLLKARRAELKQGRASYINQTIRHIGIYDGALGLLDELIDQLEADTAVVEEDTAQTDTRAADDGPFREGEDG